MKRLVVILAMAGGPVLAAGGLGSGAMPAAEPRGAGGDAPTVRFAFSKRLFAEVNENDAKAAVRIYAQTVAGENGLMIDTAHPILDGTNAIADALRHDRVDMFALATDEFLASEDLGLVGPFVVTVVNDLVTEELVLLARTDSGVQDVRDLQGRSLLVFSDPRASLGRVWLEVLCRKAGLAPADEALEKVTVVEKATRAVLPVFFRQADACVVTRNGWNLMGELNPQVNRQLRVVAVSPPIVPSVMCFRRGFPEELKQRVIAAALSTANQPASRQLMVMFRGERVAEQPVACLASARELLEDYRRLCAPANGGAAGMPETDVVQQGGSDK